MKIPSPKKTASGQYRIQLRLNGKSVTITKDTIAECKREAIAIKSAHLTGRETQKRCDMTVSEAIDAYISAHPKLSPATVRGYRSVQKHSFQGAMDKRADKVDWQAIIDAEEHAPKTIKNAFQFIVCVYGFIDLPKPKARLPEVVRKERPFLQPEQILIFLSEIKGQPGEAAALLGLHSLRRSEILDIRYCDIDLKNNIIHVRGAAVMDEHNKLVHKKENKTSSSTRDIPIMIPRLAEVIKRHKGNETDYIVTCHPNQIYFDINKVCKKAGLPLIGVHGLRHSFASLCYHLGINEMTCMRIGGWSDFDTMRGIYTHLAESDKQNAIGTITSFFA